MDYKLEKPVHASIDTVKYACTIEWRNGKFITDEPVTSGGQDSGPDPYTLLLSSLATCTLVTLRMYIDRKGWNINNIGLDANLYQNKKEDGTLTTVIDLDTRFLQAVTDEQIDRLNYIARACPISKLLEGEIKVRSYVYNDTRTEKQIKYNNDDITVVWKPDVCKHAGRCVTQLPNVFNTQARPWTNMQGATTEAIINQVQKCPTGALSFYKNENNLEE